MFEMFTERAMRCIDFGRYTATRLGSHYVEVEHFLVGVLMCHRFSKALPIEINEETMWETPLSLGDQTRETIRQKILDRISHEPPIPSSIDLPLSAEVKRIMSVSSEKRQSLSRKWIFPLDLLWGIMKHSESTPDSVVSQVLKESGITLSQVEECLAKLE